MKQTRLLYAIIILLMSSCSMRPAMYYWSKYNTAAFNYVANPNTKNAKALTDEYAKLIKKQVGSRHAVPPGVYADYGYLLIKSGRVTEGKEMMQKEITLYPESKPFIERAITQLNTNLNSTPNTTPNEK